MEYPITLSVIDLLHVCHANLRKKVNYDDMPRDIFLVKFQTLFAIYPKLATYLFYCTHILSKKNRSLH